MGDSSERIVVDENVPLAREAFGGLGAVELLPGRAIEPKHVRDATALVVRSVTRIDERLLAGSRVRFVGTATIGTDHVDLAFLASSGIAFAAAPGSNARSVAEYVSAALLELEADLERSWQGRTIGVVGVGHVGTLVAEQAAALGMAVLRCDPPRAEAEGDRSFIELARVLADADVVTLHTPLAVAGRHPTRHLIGAAELARARREVVLINTSRGPVVDGRALGESLARREIAAAVLDVWENEPTPDPSLLRVTNLASPHVAGYSLDGKLAGTRMIAESLARFLGRPAPPAAATQVAVEDPAIELAGCGRGALRAAVARACPLRDEDGRMRRLLDLPAERRAAEFDRLRRDLPVRREFAGYEIRGAALSPQDRQVLARLGFRSV